MHSIFLGIRESANLSCEDEDLRLLERIDLGMLYSFIERNTRHSACVKACS